MHADTRSMERDRATIAARCADRRGQAADRLAPAGWPPLPFESESEGYPIGAARMGVPGASPLRAGLRWSQERCRARPLGATTRAFVAELVAKAATDAAGPQVLIATPA
jgi:hypothetical protein